MSTVDGPQVLAWADRDARRRRGGRTARGALVVIAAGLALGIEAAHRGGWFRGGLGGPGTGYLVAVALLALVPTMLAAPQRMFWRPDAAMVARLPITGAALWYVAVVRAARSAGLGLLVTAPTVAVAMVADLELGARAASVALALAIASTALIPAVCLGAAHLVASGQADAATRALTGDYQVATTTWLGALPGFAISAVVIAVIAATGWVAHGEPAGMIAVIAIAAASVAAAGLATVAAPRVYPRAMREVAALDRQILAHLDVHPVTGLEAVVRNRLGTGAAHAFDRLARLTRRRYPLFSLGGAGAGIALLGVALAAPDVTAWQVVLALALGALAVSLHRAAGREPLEHARSTATLPVAPADVTRARRALVGLWLAVWAAIPVIVAVARHG